MLPLPFQFFAAAARIDVTDDDEKHGNVREKNEENRRKVPQAVSLIERKPDEKKQGDENIPASVIEHPFPQKDAAEKPENHEAEQSAYRSQKDDAQDILSDARIRAHDPLLVKLFEKLDDERRKQAEQHDEEIPYHVPLRQHKQGDNDGKICRQRHPGKEQRIVEGGKPCRQMGNSDNGNHGRPGDSGGFLGKSLLCQNAADKAEQKKRHDGIYNVIHIFSEKRKRLPASTADRRLGLTLAPTASADSILLQ